MPAEFYAGIDVGSTTTKVAIVDAAGTLLAEAVDKSGFDFAGAAETVFSRALAVLDADRLQVKRVVSTGYGRRNVAFADEMRTEIFCHAAGAYHYFPEALTIIDIGGQDNKIIRVNAGGERENFAMNRKCAAGTGAFIEEIAYRLGIDLGSLNGLAEKSEDEVSIGSFCTVFSCTEILGLLRRGTKPEDIVKGVFRSVVKRVLEMDSITGKVVLTGGVVAYNPIIARMMAEMTEREVVVAPHPQVIGAYGAALTARNL
ncbi:MAG: ATPase [Deltaproteobacteria bacterium]|nr:ATPase [Candidatus Anaeroferrophillus wilburensis]MBN2889129.1 ATPase [Deltaproteobacteria bacterium]